MTIVRCIMARKAPESLLVALLGTDGAKTPHPTNGRPHGSRNREILARPNVEPGQNLTISATVLAFSPPCFVSPRVGLLSWA